MCKRAEVLGHINIKSKQWDDDEDCATKKRVKGPG